MGKSGSKILANKYWVFKYGTFELIPRMETQVSNGSEHMPEDPREDAPSDNLKADFIYFHPTINGASWWECTCGNFLETDQKGEDRMLKRVVAHARKTGHTINPRGN